MARTRPAPAPFDPRSTTRPDEVLLRHYLFQSACSGPLFPIFFIGQYCRYVSLRYRFDDEGVWMAWGVLFKKEINLAYRRIQDINVTRGLIQRWLGLATVSVQTASGNSSAEMRIEGVLDADGLRDFLYTKMRGARGLDEEHAAHHPEAGDELLGLLTDIRDGVAALRERVETLEARP
ncbi:MAG: PH domain-containing protein [Phycisphaerales bacterium]|nr:PH domain-containing protein [Phycisphaerales bacterium]